MQLALSPAADTDRASTTEPAGTLKPADGVMAGENASILSFAYAGGAVGGKQREGLGVGDLREALSACAPFAALLLDARAAAAD